MEGNIGIISHHGILSFPEIVSGRSGNYTSCSIKKLNIPKIYYRNSIELKRRKR